MTGKSPRGEDDAPTEVSDEASATSGQRLARRQVDQDRTLEAIQAVEEVLARPSPGREVAW